MLELLNHINKRVKALPGTALPLLPLVRLALAAESGPMVRSFALVYVELGQPRAPAAEQLAAVSASECVSEAVQRLDAAVLSAIAGITASAAVSQASAAVSQNTHQACW